MLEVFIASTMYIGCSLVGRDIGGYMCGQPECIKASLLLYYHMLGRCSVRETIIVFSWNAHSPSSILFQIEAIQSATYLGT